MKIYVAFLLYIASLITLITAFFTSNINHAIFDAVLALFLYSIGRDFEKEAK